jgi:hypothetical protein
VEHFFVRITRFFIANGASFSVLQTSRITRTCQEHEDANECVGATRSRFSGGQDKRDSAISADFAGLHITWHSAIPRGGWRYLALNRRRIAIFMALNCRTRAKRAFFM